MIIPPHKQNLFHEHTPRINICTEAPEQWGKTETTKKNKSPKQSSMAKNRLHANTLTRSVASFFLFAVFPSRRPRAPTLPIYSRLLVVAVVRAGLVDLEAVNPRDVRLQTTRVQRERVGERKNSPRRGVDVLQPASLCPRSKWRAIHKTTHSIGVVLEDLRQD